MEASGYCETQQVIAKRSFLLPGQKTNISSAAGNAPPFEESDYSLPSSQRSSSGHHHEFHDKSTPSHSTSYN